MIESLSGITVTTNEITARLASRSSWDQTPHGWPTG